MNAPGTAPGPRVAVYELLNEALREVYIGFTGEPLEAFAERIKRRRPPEVKHWRDGQSLRFRCVEPALPADDAPGFIGRYAGAVAAAGMRVFWQGMRWF